MYLDHPPVVAGKSFSIPPELQDDFLALKTAVKAIDVLSDTTAPSQVNDAIDAAINIATRLQKNW